MHEKNVFSYNQLPKVNNHGTFFQVLIFQDMFPAKVMQLLLLPPAARKLLYIYRVLLLEQRWVFFF